jgi:hypothetical protein
MRTARAPRPVRASGATRPLRDIELCVPKWYEGAERPSPWSWASEPIWARVSGHAPDMRGSAGLAFLQAFTDDSAAQTGDKRLFLAGYLHRADAWASFSDSWNAELKAWPAIKYFKGSEANNLRGQFDYKQGWDEAKRNAKVSMLAKIISHYHPLSFQFSINRQIFEDELKPVAPYGFGRPHFQMCFAVVAGIAQYTAQEGITTHFEFIFDEQEGVDADIKLFFSHMKKHLPAEAQKLIDGDPIFKSDREKRYMPLQAADLLVWDVRREHETGIRLPITGNLLNKDAHLVQDIPDDSLRSWVEHHRNLPGIPLLETRKQWRGVKKEIQRLQEAGIDPSKIKMPGVHHPEGTPVLARMIDRLRLLFGRR